MDLKLEPGRVAYTISANDVKQFCVLTVPYTINEQSGWFCIPQHAEWFGLIWKEDCYLIATESTLSREEMLTHSSGYLRENAINQESNTNAS